MVWKGLISAAINHFLGSYVENFDSKQLSLALWAGHAELKNLILKQSALDELDLPIQTIYGCLGKLSFKIPWQNIYNSIIEIIIEDVYLLAVPNQQIQYDAIKEEKKQYEFKLKEILKVDEAKKKEAEKGKPKTNDTFIEKFITQLIKNVQINIKNIHIRYEDKITCPNNPFALGITLSTLNVVSTDETWQPAVTKENITKIYKVLKLEGLAVYWNSNTSSYLNLPVVDLVHKLRTEIANTDSQPENYKYILGPITATSRLRINQKPEIDEPPFEIPKIHLNLNMEKLAIGVSKAQYRDIITLADSMERMMKGVPYRKYRPNLQTYKNHYKEWWHFAYNCVLDDIKRRRRNWDWLNICNHRTLCRTYGSLYSKKLRSGGTLSKPDQEQFNQTEKDLDLFNIIIIRQRTELDTERYQKSQPPPTKSFFNWFWSSSSTQQSVEKENDSLMAQFENAMTPDEKAQLYRAIGYQENAAPAVYPEGYIDTSCTFVLNTLEVELRDDEMDVKQVLLTELKYVKCRLDTRAAASALKVHIKIGEFTTYGLRQDDYVPSMIVSETGSNDSGLLEVMFETNPLDKTCGQRLHVTGHPLKIVYDAQTINKIVDVFKMPSSTSLDQISAAAGSGLTNIKTKSVTGLQHVIDQHVHLDLNIDLHAPYILIPYGGKYRENENILVINLGNLKMVSLEREKAHMNLRRMHAEGKEETEILKEIISQSYDQFRLDFTDLQILFAQGSEDWQSVIKTSNITDMHLLTPVNLNVLFAKCLITDDPRLPLTKISGKFQPININISNARLLSLIQLGLSISLPSSDVPEPEPLKKNKSSSMMLKYLEMQETAQKTKELLPAKHNKSDDFVQFTTVDVKFILSELVVNLKHQEFIEAPIKNLASFKIHSLECDLIQQTYNTVVALRLASIGLVQYRVNDFIDILSTPDSGSEDQYLIDVKFIQVDKNSPEFHTVYRSCETSLLLTFSKLKIILHQEALLTLMQLANDVQSQVEDVIEDQRAGRDRIATTGRQLSTISEGLSISAMPTKSSYPSKSKKSPVVETIMFKLSAELDELTVEFATDLCKLSSCGIQGIQSNIIVKSSYTQVDAKLQKIEITDFNPNSIHNKILSVTGEEALSAEIVLYNTDTVQSNKCDISVKLTMGGLRIIFLNWFVSRMLNFLNQFQAAQAAIVNASQAAAESAKQNMKDAYDKATKILLNIDLKAPDIIVPETSKSYDALLLDLGHISLNNKFLTIKIKNGNDEHSAIVDELKMDLKDFKLARVKLNVEQKTATESDLLVPLTLKFTIKRNLSTSWYRAIPDIDISGRLNTVMLLLSQADYQMVMSVLSGNLAEGNESTQQNVPKIQSDTDKDKNKKDLQAIDKETNDVDVHVTQSDLEPKVFTFLRFSFTLEKLVISLFTGGSRSLTIESPGYNVRNDLGRFSLEGLSLKGQILSDNSIVTSVLLVNCLLDDTRASRQDKLTRLIERTTDTVDVATGTSLGSSTESVTPIKSMVDVTFQMKNNDMFADVKVYSFTVILSVEYLLKIAEFFTEGKSQKTDDKTTDKLNELQNSSKSVVSKTKVNTVQSVEQKASQMTINLKVEKPDIILVEHMDNIDTNALILNSEIVVKLRTSGSHQVINGTINDLQLYTCCYNPTKRSDTRSNVLHPVTISLAGSTPENKGLHLELLITDIRLSVSPRTIELLNRISATVTGSGTKDDSDIEELKNYLQIWEPKSFVDDEYWFLKTEVGCEATENAAEVFETAIEKLPLQELCILSMPCIILTLEAGVGNKTLPMLMLESSFKGSVRNWSSKMAVDASLNIQMGYYNSRLAVWEPLIEPVEIINDNRSVFVPWELKLDVSMNEQEDVLSPDSETDTDEKPSVMTIDITSENNLELSVTKTCLEVMNNLGKAFASAMKSDEIKHIEIMSQYKLVNDLGISITLMLDKGAFKVYGNNETVDVILESGTEVPLQLQMSADKTLHLSEEFFNSNTKDYMLHVNINDKNSSLEIPVLRADKRFFPLNFRGDGNDNWGVISDIKVDEGVTIITLRSMLQVYNHFNVPIEVYYMTARGNELASITIIEPCNSVNIPLNAVYTPTNELFFAVDGYSVTTTPYIWKDLRTNLTMTQSLQCSSKIREVGESFIIKAVGEMEQVYYENTTRHTMSSTCYNIHLRPAVIFRNCLPVKVICCIEQLMEETTIEPGDAIQLPNVDPGKSFIVLRLPDYLEKEWSCREEILSNPPEFSVWIFNSYDSSVRVALDLGIHVLLRNGTINMTLYCPFWMINKTGLMLAYRKSKKTEKTQISTGSPSKNADDNLNVLHHPADFKGPILFSFSAKNFFGKKKASIRVDQGDWSDKFSIDVAGSSGVVVCKANDRIYQIGVSNQLTYNGLTKQIMFTPFYVIINNASFAIQCQENDRPADHWVDIEPKSCSALWPRSELDDKLLKLRVTDTHELSAPFLYTESHTTLLKLNNKYGGINVDIQITEGATYISFASYEIGMAPALLINHTKYAMNFWEKDCFQMRNLLSKQQTLYTWENPSGPRIIVWETGKKKELQNDLRKDGVGEYTVMNDYKVYWVSFLDGMQRVLLFTEDKTTAENAQLSKMFENVQQEITVSIHGVGLSLINNITRHEVMYIGIASSGIIWEQCKMSGNHFKQFSNKDSMNLEAAYQRYLLNEDENQVRIDNKMEVDFSSNIMSKPNKRKIRRTFQTGLWLQMKTSPIQLQLHAKINRIQIDNQMYGCIFPVILAPVPPPKSVAASTGIKPFAELSIVQMLLKNSQIKQYKYFKLLIQEFHVKVDLGFINELLAVIQNEEYMEQEEKTQFLTNLQLVDEQLYSHVSTHSLQEQKSFYDLLHFSPLKIHLSFSMASGSSSVTSQNAATPNFLKVLLQGIGVTLTDLQDVVFKLGYFERDYTFLTQKQLITEVTNHYIGQTIKQVYVLVLGLDVLGNPYGLVLGITKGVEDLFYEPFQGAIQGPGEFAEGLVLGVRSLFGHTVGGAAGAVSRITGAVGKGIAALTFDEDYQRKRRNQMSKAPATAQEGIARSGKGLVMGVVDGVTGVFTKPISGAREEGVGGFFKGLGKGAVGLVARPTAGVVDFASGSLNVVKRATENTEEINRLRVPRLIQKDGLVKPYNRHESTGHKLLMELEKGKYSTTDVYVQHYVIIENKEILLLTDKRLAYITHNDIFGGWQIDWAHTWQDLKHPASVVSKGVSIPTSDSKKKKLFGSNDTTKVILIANSKDREDLCEKIESLRGSS